MGCSRGLAIQDGWGQTIAKLMKSARGRRSPKNRNKGEWDRE